MSGGGGVKHVYRGITSGSGNVTLPAAVNMDKAVVLSTSKGSAGYVALGGSTYFIMPPFTLYSTDGSELKYGVNSYGQLTTNSTSHLGLTAKTKDSTVYIYNTGNTNLTVREYSARLVDENTIYCDGPVEWQVIEYN